VVQPGDYHFNDVDMEVRAPRFQAGCACAGGRGGDGGANGAGGSA
jgi:hypothetical protein